MALDHSPIPFRMSLYSNGQQILSESRETSSSLALLSSSSLCVPQDLPSPHV